MGPQRKRSPQSLVLEMAGVTGGPRTVGEGQGGQISRGTANWCLAAPGASPDSGCRPPTSAVRGVGRGRWKEKEQERIRERSFAKG